MNLEIQKFENSSPQIQILAEDDIQMDGNITLSPITRNPAEISAPNMLNRKKYTELKLELKLALLEDMEINKYSQRFLAEKYHISKTAVQRILSQKEEIRKLAGTPQTLKRKRQIVYSDIDYHVLEWYKSCKRKKILISGPRLQAKALEIAQALNPGGREGESFTASNGWLNRWKKRNVPLTKDLDSLDCSIPEHSARWLENVPQIYQNYSPENIYNFEEANLYFRSIFPKAAGIRLDKSGKERLTLCFLTNSLGGKEAPLIIGRNKHPSCFKTIDVESVFNIIWKSDVYGGLRYEIFEEYLMKFDESLRYQNRNVLLFLDNTITCQLDLQLKLTNLKLHPYPGKITKRVAPLYLGIIKTFKHYYKNEGMLFLSTLSNDPNTFIADEEIVKKISLLDSVSWIAKSWQSVPSIVIQSCFKKANLLPNAQNIEFNDTFVDEFSSSSEEEENFISCTETVQQNEEADPNYEMTFYHHFEKQKKRSKKKTSSLISYDEALESLAKIKKLAESSKGSEILGKHISDSITELKKIIEDRKYGRQTKITEFFARHS
jgi:hypothetical protein